MRIIQKIAVYVLMLVFAAIVAGIYGALHNQMSYTFSAEYFTQFKFKQFDIAWAYQRPRLGAAYVGVLASWWMGILIFMLLGLFGFMFSTPLEMVKNLGKSFLVVMVVALLTGIVGLIYGYYHVNEHTVSDYITWLKPGVVNPIWFVRVGFMHNASYLGGLISLLSGILYLVITKLRYNKLNLADQSQSERGWLRRLCS